MSSRQRKYSDSLASDLDSLSGTGSSFSGASDRW